MFWNITLETILSPRTTFEDIFLPQDFLLCDVLACVWEESEHRMGRSRKLIWRLLYLTAGSGTCIVLLFTNRVVSHFQAVLSM